MLEHATVKRAVQVEKTKAVWKDERERLQAAAADARLQASQRLTDLTEHYSRQGRHARCPPVSHLQLIVLLTSFRMHSNRACWGDSSFVSSMLPHLTLPLVQAAQVSLSRLACCRCSESSWESNCKGECHRRTGSSCGLTNILGSIPCMLHE